jgi:hypothetical protein
MDPAIQPGDMTGQLDLGEGSAAQTGDSLALLDSPGGLMIGDFFANPYVYGDVSQSYYQDIGALSLAGGDRRFKISDNTSPIPRDRLYFTYNHFHNALFTTDGRQIDLNRYTFGGEKTFWDRLASVDFRLPVAGGLASDQFQDGIDNDEDTVFGNATIVPKAIIAAGDIWLMSVGLGINLPTADDGSLRLPNGELITVENEAVHLLPFLGFYASPNDALYAIGYLQLDFDTSGNSVTRSAPNLPSLHGVLQDPTLLHADVAFGYWIYRNEGSRLTGIAPQLEFHYTTTVQDSDVANGVVPVTSRFDLLTLTAGVNVQLYRSFLTLGCAVPLRGGDRHPEEHQYDAEAQVLFNRFF